MAPGHRQGTLGQAEQASEAGTTRHIPRIRTLVRRLRRDNPRWGAPRIHKELLKLGFEDSEETVSKYLRTRRTPDPDKSQSWRTFLHNHRDVLAAMDFFVVPTLSMGWMYVFFVIDHARRRIRHVNVTFHPTSAWVAQQLREAFPEIVHIRYLLYDRDPLFLGSVKDFLNSSSIVPKRTQAKSPWQNGVAERFVGSVRRELLDHVIIVNERHALRLLSEYVDYYNQDRLHEANDGDSPDGRAVEKPPDGTGEVVALPRLGGLAHRYTWRDAA